MRLSKREKQVLDMAQTSADDTIVSMNLRISRKNVSLYKTRARRKVAKARAFLEYMKQYRDVLEPKKKYKGVMRVQVH